MSVKTIWPTIDICRRSEGRGLLAKHAEGARWFASRRGACCWRVGQADGDPLNSSEWLELKLAEEADSIAESEQRAGVPPLDGSEIAAVTWGRRARHATLTGEYETLLATGGLDHEQCVAAFDDPARLISDTPWWIDNRAAARDDVAELVEVACGMAAVATENQFAWARRQRAGA